jgi:hypothetical protein
MLSRKQLWRKTRSSATVRERNVSKVPDVSTDLLATESQSTKVSATSQSDFPKKLRSALNLINLLSESDKARRPKDTRTMRFSSTVHICLIPSRTELKPLVPELFWKCDDYGIFKSDAVNELRNYLTANGITAKEAIFRLYQPHEDERKQWSKDYIIGEKDGDTDRDESSQSSASTTADSEDQEGAETVYNSDDDDEPTYGDDIEGLNRFSGLKTDIELNAATKQRAGSITKMPTKTPAGANSDNQHVWAVTWKPKVQ